MAKATVTKLVKRLNSDSVVTHIEVHVAITDGVDTEDQMFIINGDDLQALEALADKTKAGQAAMKLLAPQIKNIHINMLNRRAEIAKKEVLPEELTPVDVLKQYGIKGMTL